MTIRPTAKRTLSVLWARGAARLPGLGVKERRRVWTRRPRRRPARGLGRVGDSQTHGYPTCCQSANRQRVARPILPLRRPPVVRSTADPGPGGAVQLRNRGKGTMPGLGEHLRRRSPFGLVRHSKPRRSYAPLVNNLSGADEFAHTRGVLWLDRQFGRLSRGFSMGSGRVSVAASLPRKMGASAF